MKKDMKKETRKKLVRYFFQANGVANLPLGGVGAAQQSPFLARLFDPNTVSLAQFFNTLFKTAIVLGAMFAVLRLGYAGFKYMTTDLPGQKGNAREIISQAVIGLLLLLAVWLILNQINPDILNLDILRNVKSAQ